LYICIYTYNEMHNVQKESITTKKKKKPLFIMCPKNKCSHADKLYTDLDGQVKDNLVLPTCPGTGPISRTSARLWDKASIINPTCSSFIWNKIICENLTNLVKGNHYTYNFEFLPQWSLLQLVQASPYSQFYTWFNKVNCPKYIRKGTSPGYGPPYSNGN
jgi:hypothetical protein